MIQTTLNFTWATLYYNFPVDDRAMTQKTRVPQEQIRMLIIRNKGLLP